MLNFQNKEALKINYETNEIKNESFLEEIPDETFGY